MSFLIDTNVLLRIVDLAHPMNADAVKAINSLINQGEQLCIVPQNIIEFWNVYTRPADKNGLGGNIKAAEAEINNLKQIFTFLPDPSTIYQEWERLVITYKVMGVNVHDARLVAAMVVHQLSHILTFNTRDFTRYSIITTIHPTNI